jgi:hypothetical protein
LDLGWKKWQEAGEDCIMRSFITCKNYQILLGLSSQRKMRRVGHVAHMGEMRNAYKILVRKPERKRSLRRPRHRWEGNIRMDPREIGWKDVDWIHLAEDMGQWRAVVNMVMNLRVP